MSKPARVFDVGDRVYASPYSCEGTVQDVTWGDAITLISGFEIKGRWIYWVELDGEDLKPKGFSDDGLILCDR